MGGLGEMFVYMAPCGGWVGVAGRCCTCASITRQIKAVNVLKEVKEKGGVHVRARIGNSDRLSAPEPNIVSCRVA